jgi:putative YhdH/YhfP family quinone oxidoreductase
MKDDAFTALVVSETDDGRYSRSIEDRRVEDLPAGEVLVKVAYSSLNYKDALSASGNRGVTRSYPHTPGIDAAGAVVESSDSRFSEGDPVIVTSYDLGMNTPGGFGQYIRVPADWVVPQPAELTAREAMCYGTAGFTAALSVYQLVEHGVKPEDGEIIVSGATGGVGSIAVAILVKIGYEVAAVNGVVDETDYLQRLGAGRVIDLEEAGDQSGRPLLKGIYGGGIDTVGGIVLATTLKSVRSNGIVTCCGNVASADLPTSVYPFILRGITLVGIDSQNCAMEHRLKVWHLLAGDWKIAPIEDVVDEIKLADLDRCIERMLKGEHRGRTVVRLND